MAKFRNSSLCLGMVIFSALLGTTLSKIISTPSGVPPKNYNIQVQRTGETIKAAASHTPYSTEYVLDGTLYNPAEYETAESANFGSYGIGPGQLIGGGGGYSGGLGFGGGGGGINQFGGFGGGDIGFGNGFSGGYSGGGGGLGGGLGGGISNVGGGYISQPYYSGGIGLGGGGGGGYIGGGGYSGGGGGGYGGSIGGGYVDKNQYESGKKNSGDENTQKVQAKSQESANQGQQGSNAALVEQSSAKGDSGYYKDESANKKEVGDGKTYQGASSLDKKGQNGESENMQKSHKKGHVTKGFKSSSRKDEEEKTESFYDEAHDEADNKKFGVNEGAQKENSASSFKGGHENESLDAKAQAKEGTFKSQNKVEDSKVNKGEFGQSSNKGSSEHFSKANELGAQSILGHQESSGQYLKNKPFGIV